MLETHHFVRVDFNHFKAFDRFSLTLRHFNILVGPNNAGKSTILAAFRFWPPRCDGRPHVGLKLFVVPLASRLVTT